MPLTVTVSRCHCRNCSGLASALADDSATEPRTTTTTTASEGLKPRTEANDELVLKLEESPMVIRLKLNKQTDRLRLSYSLSQSVCDCECELSVNRD